MTAGGEGATQEKKNRLQKGGKTREGGTSNSQG